MYYSKSFLFILAMWASSAAAEGEFERERRQALMIEALTQQVKIAERKLKLKAVNKELANLDQDPVSESVSALEKQDASLSVSPLPDPLIEPGHAAFPLRPKPVFKHDARLIEIIGGVALIEFDGRRYLVRRQDKLEGYTISSISKNSVRLTHISTKRTLTLPLFNLSGATYDQGNMFSPLPSR